MRTVWHLITLVLTLVLTACATTPARPESSSTRLAQSIEGDTVDAVLGHLENRGKSLRDLSGVVKVTTNEQDSGTVVTVEGKFWFQNRDDARNQDVNLRISYHKWIQDNSAHPMDTEYVLADGWLCERDHMTKVQNRWQIAAAGERVDLLALDEAPIPLPIGQPPSRMHNAFDIQLLGNTMDGVPNTVHLRMVPKPGTHLAHRFATIDLWVDLISHLPTRSQMLHADRPVVDTIVLEHLQINQGMRPDQFHLPELRGWTQHDEPYER